MPDTGFGVRSLLHRGDLERNLRSVRDARRMADWVIYSVHNHEYGDTEADPAQHVRYLAHAVIDFGALD